MGIKAGEIEQLENELQKAKETLDEKKTIKILDKLIDIHKKEKNYRKLQKAINDIIPLLDGAEMKAKKARILLLKSQLLVNSAEYNNSIKSANEALNIFQELKNTLDSAECYSLIGNSYNMMGNYKESLSYLFLAINTFEKNKSKIEKTNQSLYKLKYAETLRFISHVYYNLKQIDKNREYLYKTLKIYEEINNTIGIATIMSNLGVSYSKEDPQKTLKYYQQALEIMEKTNAHPTIAANISNIGGVYEDIKQYDKALQYYFKALNYAKKFKLDKYMPYFLEYIGSVYLKIGRFDEAIEFTSKSLELFTNFKAMDEMKNNYQLLSKIYEQKKNYKTALEYYQKYSDLSNELINKEMINKLSGLQKKYEAYKNKVVVLNKNNSLISETLKNKMDMDFIGTSKKIKKVLEQALTASKYPDTNVLILGESGTGKEIIANLIHYNSSRKNNLIIAINCSSIPDSLVESEFFGFVKGSFTGAFSDKIGYFEMANNGTLFMDEIAETPTSLQAKLLRVLESKEIRKIGSDKKIKLDFRIIAATNRNIEDLVEKDYFRLDLFYRLNTIEIEIPPLRERKEDIKPLVEYFIRKFATTMKISIPKIEETVFDNLKKYTFPGNVRELRNMVEKAMILLDDDVLKPKHFGFKEEKSLKKIMEDYHKPKTIAEMERKMIADTMQQTNNNMTKTAKILGISFSTLKRKLKNSEK